jgi:gamma-glutamyl-gamma-aminobutyrate hydrolase PuuD
VRLIPGATTLFGGQRTENLFEINPIVQSYQDKRPLLCTCFGSQDENVVFFGGLTNQVKEVPFDVASPQFSVDPIVVAQHDDAVKCVKYVNRLGGLLVR